MIWKLPISLRNRTKLAFTLLKIKRRYGFLVDEALGPKNEKVKELNSMTLEGFIGSCDPGLKEFWKVLSISSTSKPPPRVAAYYPLKAFLHFLDEEYYVEVAHVDSGLRVTYLKNGRRCTASNKRCVVAVPAPQALSMLKDMPDWKREVLSRIQFGPGTTAAFRTTSSEGSEARWYNGHANRPGPLAR
ncbi:MAG: hypothetical protein V3U79_00620 [Dehalococcoidia bacterium]